MQNLIATTFEVVHYIALQAVHYKPLQEVHLSRYNHGKRVIAWRRSNNGIGKPKRVVPAIHRARQCAPEVPRTRISARGELQELCHGQPAASFATQHLRPWLETASFSTQHLKPGQARALLPIGYLRPGHATASFGGDAEVA